MNREEKKEITLDDLAVMVANGFNSVNEQFKGVNSRLDTVESRLGKVESRLHIVESQLHGLEKEMEGLRSSVNNYLALSDKRYLELKARQNIIAGWVKEIGDKAGIKINLEELEKVS